jgi:hypothetical protein
VEALYTSVGIATDGSFSLANTAPVQTLFDLMGEAFAMDAFGMVLDQDLDGSTQAPFLQQRMLSQNCSVAGDRSTLCGRGVGVLALENKDVNLVHGNTASYLVRSAPEPARFVLLSCSAAVLVAWALGRRQIGARAAR